MPLEHARRTKSSLGGFLTRLFSAITATEKRSAVGKAGLGVQVKLYDVAYEEFTRVLPRGQWLNTKDP
jgi:hypothetical protein